MVYAAPEHRGGFSYNNSGLWYTSGMDGVVRCGRYAFGPNKLHLCGPDANQEVLAYLKEGAGDPGLAALMKRFSTLYPYLRQIASANGIADAFDERVVEAYWIGNELLETVPLRTFYRHLADTLRLKARGARGRLDSLAATLPKGARMHHSFHVFNVYQRTDQGRGLHTVEAMDACRVSWGRVVSVDGPSITVMRKPLRLEGHALALGLEESFRLTRRLEDDAFESPQVGQLITMHWNVPCEVVNKQNAAWLERYTLRHIALANETL